MPVGEVRVCPADLVTHAGHVEALADTVTTAEQAGKVVRLDAGAYGKLCTVVPILLGVLQDMVTGGIDAAAQSLHGTGERLRAVACGYESADEASAANLNSLWSRL